MDSFDTYLIAYLIIAVIFFFMALFASLVDPIVEDGCIYIDTPDAFMCSALFGLLWGIWMPIVLTLFLLKLVFYKLPQYLIEKLKQWKW